MKTLVIFDEDKDYAISLADALAIRKVFAYEIQVYSSENNFNDILKVDILITSKVLNIKAKHILFLVEHETNNEYEIYKYQSVDKIIQKILSSTGIKSINAGKNKIFLTLIFSRFNPNLVDIYLRKFVNNEKILFINIDSLFFTTESIFNFNELIYLLETDYEGLKLRLFNLLSANRNIKISGEENLVDIINYKGWENLIRILNEVGIYKKVIVVLPFLAGFKELINLCDEKIYILSKDVSDIEEKYINNLEGFKKEVVDGG